MSAMVKRIGVVLPLSTLSVQLEHQLFSLLLIFHFGCGNLLECRMQNEKAVEGCAAEGSAEAHVH